MSQAAYCPSCGSPLTGGEPNGLCARCLLKRGMESATAGYSEADKSARAWEPPAPGDLAGQFADMEVIQLLGRGGMGAVYKARQKQLDRVVALKILPPDIGKDPAFAERFTREAKALARLNHPNIVTLYEFGRTSAGLYYFLMEYVDGVNLRHLMDGGRISPREALAIVPHVCDALQYAHDSGIVHRDIKPANILLDRRGRVKVADFGLAKITGQDERSGGAEAVVGSSPAITEIGKVVGTPQYMAPEQATNPGTVDHRADIYALGVVFYQMLTGELPGRQIEAPSHKVQIDVRLDEVVLRAMERDPELRYAQASVIKTQVETIVSTPNRTEPAPGQQNTFNPREPELIAIAMVFFVVMIFVLIFIWAERPGQAGPVCAFMIAFCAGGLGVCGVRWAGYWPLPSWRFPRPNFSSRNLSRGNSAESSPGIKSQAAPIVMPAASAPLGYAAFYCAVLSGLIPTIFHWLGPWLAPDITPRGREFWLWATLACALGAIGLGYKAGRSRLGQTAIGVGAVNLTVWLLLFIAGIFSAQHDAAVQNFNTHPDWSTPNSPAVPPPITPWDINPATPAPVVPRFPSSPELAPIAARAPSGPDRAPFLPNWYPPQTQNVPRLPFPLDHIPAPATEPATKPINSPS